MDKAWTKRGQSVDIMAKQFVTGVSKILAQLTGIRDSVRKQVIEVVEKNAVRVANHAKEKHGKGFAHAIGRYENQTTNLTNDIRAHNAQVVGNVVEASIATNKEYAPRVEFGTSRTKAYPFMGPALHAIEPRYLAELRALKIGD